VERATHSASPFRCSRSERARASKQCSLRSG
jgi:hypothetical protein